MANTRREHRNGLETVIQLLHNGVISHKEATQMASDLKAVEPNPYITIPKDILDAAELRDEHHFGSAVDFNTGDLIPHDNDGIAISVSHLSPEEQERILGTGPSDTIPGTEKNRTATATRLHAEEAILQEATRQLVAYNSLFEPTDPFDFFDIEKPKTQPKPKAPEYEIPFQDLNAKRKITL